MVISGKHFIGYSRSGNHTEKFEGTLKNDTGGLYTFFEANGDEINLAVEKAAAAALPYKQLTYSARATFLEKIAEEIVGIGAELIAVTQKETCLPEARLLGERDRTTSQLKFFAKMLREGNWVKAVIDLSDANVPAKADLRQVQVPLGVVGVFGASNFPYAFSVAGGDTVSALAAGCPVVYKSHPGHPVTSELVAGAIIRAAQATGMPDGVFSLIQGATHQTGLALVRHPLVKAIGFTGSYQGGKALFDEAAKRDEPIPVYSEMGSVNPVFILPGILQEQGSELAKALAASNLLGVGQFCTNPGIAVLPNSTQTPQFLNSYKESIEATAGGKMLNQNIYKAYCKGTEELTGNSNVAFVAKGSTTAENTVVPYMFSTTAARFLADKQLSEELFGPSVLHVTTQSKQEILNIARNLKGQLTATIWGNYHDLEEYSDLCLILEDKAGRLIVNGMPTGVEIANAMVHGGPFPATTNAATTSVGAAAIYRFTRPVCFQNFPDSALPGPLKNGNPLGILRQVNGIFTADPVK